jgi:hypothetical protein
MPARPWFFEDQNFEFLTLIVLGSVAHRMGETGEVLATVSAVDDGDSQSWFDAWMQIGERVEAVAKDAEAKGHSQTARDAYLRASTYLGTAFFNILGSSQADQKVEVWNCAGNGREGSPVGGAGRTGTAGLPRRLSVRSSQSRTGAASLRPCRHCRVVDSYALVFAGLLLVGGSLADRLGRKRFFLIELTVFAAGSIGAALSGSADL